MRPYNNFTKLTFGVILIGSVLSSCKKKTDEVIKEVIVTETVNAVTPALRAKFDYSLLTATTPYDSLFLDENKAKTVDLADGNARLNMFVELNTYVSSVNGVGTKTPLDVQKLKNYFYNSNAVFTAIPSLNTSALNIRAVTGSSRGDAPIIRAQIEGFLQSLTTASDSVNTTASIGKAGKVALASGTSAYLIDSNGVEYGQVIQKGLIGGFQLDYISNVLLNDSKLNADNHHLVSGENYTELEHNWDEAFATLTINPKKVYALTATDDNSGGEKYLGSYLREYGNSAYGNDFLKIHPAFLKGRAAIVNNDLAEVKAQASIIKGIFEMVVARAAIGYLGKWKASAGIDQGAAAHAMGEGFGFIYALRFCKLNGADDTFSDGLMNDLVYSKQNGVWDLTSLEATTAINKIKAKFAIQ